MLGLISMASAIKPMRHDRTRKGQLTSSACLQCRRRKTKCSGGRPACLRCSDRGDVCNYDTEEGMSKQQGLRAQLRRKEDQITRMRGVLRLSQSGSDGQAAELLSRLRSNCQVDKSIHAEKSFSHSDQGAVRANVSSRFACHKVPKSSSESTINCHPCVGLDAIFQKNKEQMIARQYRASMLTHSHQQLESEMRSSWKSHCDPSSTDEHGLQDMLSISNAPPLLFSSTSNPETANSDCPASQHQPTLVPSNAPSILPCYNLIQTMGTTLNGTECFPVVSPHDTATLGSL